MIAPAIGLIIGICLCACLVYVVIHPEKNQIDFETRSQRRKQAKSRYTRSRDS
jgi:hypothetical protein